MELTFVHGISSFLCAHPLVKKAILSPLTCLSISVENQLTLDVRAYFRTVNSIPLIYMSVLMPGPQSRITVVF